MYTVVIILCHVKLTPSLESWRKYNIESWDLTNTY